jgi:hypothetical protein
MYVVRASYIGYCVNLYGANYFPDVGKHVLLMSSVFGSNDRCDQLHSLMNYVKSKTRMHLPNKHMEGCMRIIAAEIEPDIETLLK